MQTGDLVVSIGGRDVKWLPHDRVVAAIRDSGDTLHMTLVTPITNPSPSYFQLTKVTKNASSYIIFSFFRTFCSVIIYSILKIEMKKIV